MLEAVEAPPVSPAPTLLEEGASQQPCVPLSQAAGSPGGSVSGPRPRASCGVEQGLPKAAPVLLPVPGRVV